MNGLGAHARGNKTNIERSTLVVHNAVQVPGQTELGDTDSPGHRTVVAVAVFHIQLDGVGSTVSQIGLGIEAVFALFDGLHLHTTAIDSPLGGTITRGGLVLGVQRGDRVENRNLRSRVHNGKGLGGQLVCDFQRRAEVTATAARTDVHRLDHILTIQHDVKVAALVKGYGVEARSRIGKCDTIAEQFAVLSQIQQSVLGIDDQTISTAVLAPGVVGGLDINTLLHIPQHPVAVGGDGGQMRCHTAGTFGSGKSRRGCILRICGSDVRRLGCSLALASNIRNITQQTDQQIVVLIFHDLAVTIGCCFDFQFKRSGGQFAGLGVNHCDVTLDQIVKFQHPGSQRDGDGAIGVDHASKGTRQTIRSTGVDRDNRVGINRDGCTLVCEGDFQKTGVTVVLLRNDSLEQVPLGNINGNLLNNLSQSKSLLYFSSHRPHSSEVAL